MSKHILLFLISITTLSAQPYYTPLRAAFSIECLGIAPVIMFTAEVPWHYGKRDFLNSQLGLGFTGDQYAISPSATFSVTNNYLLNPYRRSLCSPEPDYNVIETYLETGLACSLFDPYYGGLPSQFDREKKVNPSAILGLRFHIVKAKWIYIFKCRFTPYLNNDFIPWGGIAIGLGWR